MAEKKANKPRRLFAYVTPKPVCRYRVADISMTRKNQAIDAMPAAGTVSVTMAVFLAALTLYALIAWIYVRTGLLNADEGIYCVAAKKAAAGSIPYRDFGYSQMPVLPYVNGLAMKIVGFGYLEQRTVNAVWGALTIVAVFYLGLLMGNRYAGAVAAWATATSLYWVHFLCMGKTYAGTGLFLVLAALSIYLRGSYYKKTLLFSLAAVGTVGCRLTTAPALLLLWVLMIMQAKGGKQRAAALTLPVLAGAVAFLPFFLADRENFLFWNLSYHLGTSFNRRGWPSIKEHLALSPAILVLMTVGLAAALAMLRRLNVRQAGLLVLALIGITIQLCMKSSYGEYSVPYLPICAVGAAVILAKLKWFQKLWPAFLVLCLLAWLGPRPNRQNHMPDALLDTARFVSEHTHAKERVLTCFPIVAVQAQREVFPGLEMGKFAVTSEIPQNKAQRLHLVTPTMLTDLVKTRQPGAVIITCFLSRWNFAWSVPSLRLNDTEQMQLLSNTLNQHYRPAFQKHPFVVLLPNRSE